MRMCLLSTGELAEGFARDRLAGSVLIRRRSGGNRTPAREEKSAGVR
jgi:hypothetical protein